MNETWATKRRRFKARWQVWTAANGSLGVWAENVSRRARRAFAESQQLTVERKTIVLRRLPRAFDGLRVVQLSDVHHSPYTDAAQVRDAVKIANDLQPDLVVLTGDYVSHDVEYIAPVADLLGELRAPLGVFGVLGNHDNETSTEITVREFQRANINLLINEGRQIVRNNSSFWLGGVDDVKTGVADVAAAMYGAKLDDLKILLCHNPIILPRAAESRIDLVISGHTHGGQVKLRGRIAERLIPADKRATGLQRAGETQIYVSRGIGTVVLPIRYHCPPEISLLELRAV